jgi:serine/threonine protein kinase
MRMRRDKRPVRLSPIRPIPRPSCRIAGQLDRPNIIKVYSRGEESMVSFLAMELAEGGSLADFIKKTRASLTADADVTDSYDREFINDMLSTFIALASALFAGRVQENQDCLACWVM